MNINVKSVIKFLRYCKGIMKNQFALNVEANRWKNSSLYLQAVQRLNRQVEEACLHRRQVPVAAQVVVE